MKPTPETVDPMHEAGVSLDDSRIMQQVERILDSPVFLSSRRLSEFFRYISVKTISGQATKIKQFTIGVEVYGREPDFDPKNDPIVRIEAGRLRRKLREYYDNQGKFDRLYIKIPRGNYVPNFQWKQLTDPEIIVKSTRSDKAHELDSPIVAVFPFVINEGSDFEYLVAGLGTELVDELSRSSDQQVLAYYTTSQFRGGPDNLYGIADSLGIDFAVTGAIRATHERLRVNVQLIDTHSGKQIWSERFDLAVDNGQIDELEFVVASNVSGRIADQHGIITREMSNRLPRENLHPSAYEAILRGHSYMLDMTVDGFRLARIALERAVRIEPDSATAWAMLSVLYLDSVVFEYAEIPDAYQLGVKYASIATSKEPSNQMANHSRAYVGLVERDRAAIEHSARRMISINENAASMVATAGFWLCLAGLFDEGMKWFKKGTKLNPSYPGWLNAAPYFYHLQAGEYELALQHANDFGMPDFSWSPLMKAAVLGLLGRFEEAARSYSCLLELEPDFEEDPRSYISNFVLEKSLMDTVLRGLQAAGMLGSANLPAASASSRNSM